MNDWFERLDDVVVRAGELAGLPGPVVRGFDGDSWVWLWRNYLDGQTRVAETLFRARPDSLETGLHTEVSAMAWMVDQRQLSWARPYGTRYLDLKSGELVSPDQAAQDRLAEGLAERLSDAWKGAMVAVAQLEDLDAHRERTIRKVREQGLLGR